MPNWLRALPLWLRMILGVLLIVAAAAPGMIAPSLFESYGWGRETGSNVGWLVSMALFGLCYLLARWINRREAKWAVGREVDRLVAPYRDDEDGGDHDDRDKDQR